MESRKLPRPFTMHWGGGQVVEEAWFESEFHQPTIQLLQYDDGPMAGEISIRFCSFVGGRFQRSPLIINETDLEPLKEAIGETMYSAMLLEFYGQEIKRIYGRTLVRPAGSRVEVQYHPVGPVAGTSTRLKPAATAASTVPSPPSATGTLTIWPSKPARTRPAVSRAATSDAGRLPLNLSGASSTLVIGKLSELGKSARWIT